MGVELVPHVTIPVLHIVSSEMLAGCHDSLVFLIRATLEPINEGRYVGRQVEDVLTWDFLSPAPAWVFEAIDIWSPEIETAPIGIVECVAFRADDRYNSVDEFVVKSSTHENGLGH